MYTTSFKELVDFADSNSATFYQDLEAKPNPFYIGFGNPNAKILIVGQEKAIQSNNERQIRAESSENPRHWKYLLENMINDIDYRFYADYHFKNPLHPYDGKPTKGNTWLQYQKLINFVYQDFERIKENSFLLNSFITEVNHQVSPKQLGNREDEERQFLNNHPFYKSFNVTILAIGKYLTNSEIEKRYDVNVFKDLSEPRQRLIIFKNESENRIVLNIRQLSNDISTNYLQMIADIIRKYVC